MNIINGLFGIVFYPCDHLHPAWGMIWISLLTGVIMLIIFRFTSNQQGIKKSKTKIGAYILEMRLFSHDLGKMLAALGKTLAANILYLRFMIVPLIFIIVPVLIVLLQASYRYESRPVRPGEQVIVKAVLKPEFPVIETPIRLKVPNDINNETPPLRISSLNEVDWRISGRKQGVYELDFMVNGIVFKKNIHIYNELVSLSAKRAHPSFYAFLLNHSESELPDDSPFAYIQVMYPDRTLTIMGIELNWIIWFFVLSLMFSMLFKKIMGVEL